MRLGWCLLLFGCGRVGFATVANGAPGDATDASAPGDQHPAPDGPPLCTSLAQLTYNFDNSNPALWMPFVNAGFTLSETGNQLVIPLPNNKAGTVGYFSSCLYDLRGQRVFITAAMVPRLGTRTDMYLAVGTQADAFGINVTQGNTQAYRITGANYTTYASVAYNATAHKIWQIREAGGTVFWEVSADGVTFMQLYSAAPPFAVSAVQLLIFADEFVPVNNPGTAQFAKLDLP
jgi:hypothetical protein